MPRLTQARIREVIQCPQWQDFRKGLKGINTEEKLARLEWYVVPHTWRDRRRTVWADDLSNTSRTDKYKKCCTYEVRCAQALNYLNALARGGLIMPLPFWCQDTTKVEEYLMGRYEVIK